MLTVVGCVALVVAIVWRASARRRAHGRVVAALSAPETRTRLAALDLVGRRGLAPFAQVLLRRLADEPDIGVWLRIVALVTHHQWEPLGSQALLELRLEVAEVARADRILEDARRHGDQVIRLHGHRVLGHTALAPARELVRAASDALDQEVCSLRLSGLGPPGPTFVFEGSLDRGWAALADSPASADRLVQRFRDPGAGAVAWA